MEIAIMVAVDVIATIVLLSTGVRFVTLRWHVPMPVAVAATLVALAAASYAVVILTFFQSYAGYTLAGLVWLVVALVFVRTEAWRLARQWWQVCASMAGVAMLDVGLMLADPSRNEPFDLAAHVDRERLLPGDNYLPTYFATYTFNNQPTHAFYSSWNGSDRPPLQSGSIILFNPLEQGVHPNVWLSAVTFAASFVMQLLWLPSTWALLRALGVRHQAAIAAVFAASATSTVWLNSIFTWPKLLSTALVFSAVIFMIAMIRGWMTPRWGTPLALAAALFATLAHGAALLAAPLLVIVAFLVVRATGLRAQRRPLAMAVSFAVVCYAPWFAYQRWVDPEQGRLIKWHFAGHPGPTSASFLSLLKHAYGTLGWSGTLENKGRALRDVFLRNPFEGLLPWTSTSLEHRVDVEFLRLIPALGLSLAVLAIAVAVSLWRRRAMTSTDRGLAVLVVGSVASIAVWCLAMFDPEGLINHQGSHVWIVLLIVAPMAWLATRNALAAWIIVCAQLALTVAMIWQPFLAHGEHVRRSSLALVVLGILVMVLSAIDSHRSRPAASEPEVSAPPLPEPVSSRASPV